MAQQPPYVVIKGPVIIRRMRAGHRSTKPCRQNTAKGCREKPVWRTTTSMM
jgi:hypothetical protein